MEGLGCVIQIPHRLPSRSHVMRHRLTLTHLLAFYYRYLILPDAAYAAFTCSLRGTIISSIDSTS